MHLEPATCKSIVYKLHDTDNEERVRGLKHSSQTGNTVAILRYGDMQSRNIEFSRLEMLSEYGCALKIEKERERC